MRHAFWTMGRTVVGILGVAALATALAAPLGDALTAARYVLTIDGFAIGTFTELVAVRSTSNLPPSPTDGPVTKAPTGNGAGEVILRRGLNNSMEIAAWHEQALLGDPAARRSASLTAYASDGRAVARFHLQQAWPSKLEVGALKAGASEVLLETVTITTESIDRVAQ